MLILIAGGGTSLGKGFLATSVKLISENIFFQTKIFGIDNYVGIAKLNKTEGMVVISSIEKYELSDVPIMTKGEYSWPKPDYVKRNGL